MKMKKILSMGALGLVLACSTSVGALGAERPSNDKIKTDMANLFLGNKNALNYDLNGSTLLGSIVNTKTVKADATSYGYYDSTKTNFPNISRAIELMNPSQSINNNMINIYKDKDINIDNLLVEVKQIAQDLRDMENDLDSTNKLALENNIKSLIKEKDAAVTVIFGKNIDGKITMSILKRNQILLQLNSGNSYTINKALNGGSKLDQYATLLGIFAGTSNN